MRKWKEHSLQRTKSQKGEHYIYYSSLAPEGFHDLPGPLEILRLGVRHLRVVIVHHPDELPHVQFPVVVHVCPRHQLVDLRMSGIIT